MAVKLSKIYQCIDPIECGIREDDWLTALVRAICLAYKQDPGTTESICRSTKRGWAEKTIETIEATNIHSTNIH